MPHEDHGHGHDLNVKKVDRISPTRVRLSLEYSADTVSKHESMTARRYHQSARIPGFRPGKAPIGMVTKKYKEEILKDVVFHLVEAGIQEAIEKTRLIPVNRPRLSQISPIQFGQNKPLEFQAEYEVHPEIELRHYKGIPLKVEEVAVTEEEVSRTLNTIREKLAVLEPLEREKPEKGDFAALEVSYTLKGEPARQEKNISLTVPVGEGRLLPELDAALLNMRVGEGPKAVDAKFPVDYDDKALQGREATFECRILDLKKKVLPELTDALAAQLKPGGTLESLKQDIRQNIQVAKSEEVRRRERAQVVDYLVANHPFEAPASLVQRQTLNLLQGIMDDMRQRGVKPALPEKEEELKLIQQRAEQMVKASLLLREIATKEKIEVDETKVQAQVEAMASQAGRSVEEVEAQLEREGQLDELRDRVLTDQVFEFLIHNAQRVGTSPQA